MAVAEVGTGARRVLPRRVPVRLPPPADVSADALEPGTPADHAETIAGARSLLADAELGAGPFPKLYPGEVPLEAIASRCPWVRAHRAELELDAGA